MTAAFKPLTKDDIAEVLGVSMRTIEHWVNDKTLPAPKRLGNRVYWHPGVFYGWLEHRLTNDAEQPEPAVMANVSQQPVMEKKDRLSRSAKPVKTELEQLKTRDHMKLNALLS